ncbi:unnamed protein product, partial [Choristocarpus tenellus]
PEVTPFAATVSTASMHINVFHRILNHAGPKKVKSFSGAEYALAIVDDATRFTWI